MTSMDVAMPFASPFNGAASYFAKHRDLRGEIYGRGERLLLFLYSE